MKYYVKNQSTDEYEVCEWRWLEREEIGLVTTLMRDAHIEMDDPSHLIPDTKEDILGYFNDGGGCIGAFVKDKLIGFRTFTMPTTDNQAEGLVDPEYHDRVVHLETVVVLPDYRGNQIQLRSFYFLKAYLPDNKRFLFNTVAPQNKGSLVNIFKTGSVISKIENMYASDHHPEGVLRYLMTNGIITKTSCIYIGVDPDDLAEQRRLLDSGYAGTHLMEDGRVAYAEIEETAVPYLPLM